MSATPPAMPMIPVSWGELVDKLTVVEIKHERIRAGEAARNVDKELELLRSIAEPVLRNIADLRARLGTINRELWDIENVLREKEAAGDFGPAFIALARAVYKKNDERAALKREINRILKSELVEEKSYTTNRSSQPE